MRTNPLQTWKKRNSSMSSTGSYIKFLLRLKLILKVFTDKFLIIKGSLVNIKK